MATEVNDYELLELAAKGCGWAVVPRSQRQFGGPNVHVGGGATIVNWNPLTDDGDALRLAVKLHMDFTLSGKHAAVAQAGTHMKQEFCNGDPYAATRRAIVRAAAELGKAMQ